MTSGQPSPPVPRDAGGQPGGGHSAGWVAEALREHDDQAGRAQQRRARAAARAGAVGAQDVAARGTEFVVGAESRAGRAGEAGHGDVRGVRW